MNPETIQFLSWERLRTLPQPQGSDLWLALPVKRFRRAEQYLDLPHLDGIAVGHYRLCQADELLAHRWPHHRPASHTAERPAATAPR